MKKAIFHSGPLGLSLRIAFKKYVTVDTIENGGQAFNNGLRVGSILISIAGKTLNHMPLKKVVALLSAVKRPFEVEYTGGDGLVDDEIKIVENKSQNEGPKNNRNNRNNSSSDKKMKKNTKASNDNFVDHEQPNSVATFEKGPLGFSLAKDDKSGDLVISKMIEGGQASKQGMKIGATIFVVAGQQARSKTLDDIFQIIKNASWPIVIEYRIKPSIQETSDASNAKEAHNIGKGWWAVLDAHSDQFYFVDSQSGKTQWDWPDVIPQQIGDTHDVNVTFQPGALGLSLRKFASDNRYLQICDIHLEGQAHLAGIQSGAILEAVGDTSLVNLTLEEATDVIKKTTRPCIFKFINEQSIYDGNNKIINNMFEENNNKSKRWMEAASKFKLSSQAKKNKIVQCIRDENKKKSKLWIAASSIYEKNKAKTHSIHLQENAKKHALIHSLQTVKRAHSAKHRLEKRLGKRKGSTGKSFVLKKTIVKPTKNAINNASITKTHYQSSFIDIVKDAKNIQKTVSEVTKIQDKASKSRRKSVDIILKKKSEADIRVQKRLNLRKKAKQKNLLKRCPLFESMSMEEHDAIVNVMEYETHEKGATLCKQGDTAEKMYIIMSGNCNVFCNSLHVAILYELDVFGESALVTGQFSVYFFVKRFATVLTKLFILFFG